MSFRWVTNSFNFCLKHFRILICIRSFPLHDNTLNQRTLRILIFLQRASTLYCRSTTWFPTFSILVGESRNAGSMVRLVIWSLPAQRRKPLRLKPHQSPSPSVLSSFPSKKVSQFCDKYQPLPRKTVQYQANDRGVFQNRLVGRWERRCSHKTQGSTFTVSRVKTRSGRRDFRPEDWRIERSMGINIWRTPPTFLRPRGSSQSSA